MINEGEEPENFFWVGIGGKKPYDEVLMSVINFHSRWFVLYIQEIPLMLLSKRGNLIIFRVAAYNLSMTTENSCRIINYPTIVLKVPRKGCLKKVWLYAF